MNFKDALAHDVRTVFCNPDEFGEEILVDDTAVTAIIKDSHQSPSQQMGNLADVSTMGTLLADRILSISTGIIPTPVSGQQLCINGEYWIVISVTDTFGMLKIALQKTWS